MGEWAGSGERPLRVRPGATVAVVCPSAPGLSTMPARASTGRRYLENELGMLVRFMPYSTGSDGWMSAEPRQRAEDINEAFADDDVDVVLCALGGNLSTTVLPHLDFETIRAHPKVFQGYSDITVLHWAIQRNTGLQTFYGPMLVMSLAEAPAVLPFTDQSMRQAWFGSRPIEIQPSCSWTEELLDLTAKTLPDNAPARRLTPTGGWRTVRRGRAAGPLLVGCLEPLTWHVRGTRNWLDPAGSILMLDIALPGHRWGGMDIGGPDHVEGWLHTLATDGHLDGIAGLVVGRPRGYLPAERDRLDAVITACVGERDIPIIMDFDIGHTDPMATLPIGANVVLDADHKVLRTMETPTAARITPKENV